MEKEERIIKVINKKFDEYIEERRSDLSLIDERILEVRKLLQLVRYGAVKEYYAATQPKKHENSEKGLSIHPATKALLIGKRPRPSNQVKLEPSSSNVGHLPPLNNENYLEPPLKKKTLTPLNNYVLQSRFKKEAPKNVPPLAKDNLPPCYMPPLAKDNLPPCYVPPLAKGNPFKTLIPRAAQHKEKRRIVVGNVSRWIPEEGREGASTHKWMVYVRGEEHAPALPEVAKVVFTLHESYSPHDVVEVTAHPFHLTRRGWGEFPLKVEIYFANLENKPVQVVHNLKLDKTLTGHQTLGAETILDVFLFKHKAASSN